MDLFNNFKNPGFGRADEQRRKLRRSTSGIAFALTRKLKVSGFLIKVLNPLTDNVSHPRCLRGEEEREHPTSSLPTSTQRSGANVYSAGRLKSRIWDLVNCVWSG